jgi:hypothetical protein
VIVTGLVEPVLLIPPGLDVTVYEVIGLPPTTSGGLTVTKAPWLRADATGAGGWLGTVAGMGVTGLEGDDGWLDPLALNATTVNV